MLNWWSKKICCVNIWLFKTGLCFESVPENPFDDKLEQFYSTFVEQWQWRWHVSLIHGLGDSNNISKSNVMVRGFYCKKIFYRTSYQRSLECWLTSIEENCSLRTQASSQPELQVDDNAAYMSSVVFLVRESRERERIESSRVETTRNHLLDSWSRKTAFGTLRKPLLWKSKS